MSTDDTDRIAKALLRGKNAAKRLGPATDDLTRRIADLERSLSELRMGVEAAVSLPFEDDVHDYDHYLQLTFRKEGKTWRLLVESGVVDDPSTHNARPLVNESREMRMKAMEALPALIEKMAEAAEQQLAEVEKSNSKAVAILSHLHKNSAPEGAA